MVLTSLIQKLKAFKRRVKAKFGLDEMLLFGSRARGDHLQDSDADVVLVSRGFSNLSFPRRLSAVSELWMEKTRMDALCYTPEEFKRLKLKSYVLSAAVREGICI